MDYSNINDYETLYMIKEHDDYYLNLMFKKYYPLILKTASKYIELNKYIDCELSELIEEGNIILSKAIDTYINKGYIDITDDDIKEIKKIFNRQFTKGFLFHEENDKFTNPYRPNHMGIEIGKIIDYKNNKVTIKLSDELNIGDGIRILGNDIGLTVSTMFKNNKKVESAYKQDLITIPLKDRVEILSLPLSK